MKVSQKAATWKEEVKKTVTGTGASSPKVSLTKDSPEGLGERQEQKW